MNAFANQHAGMLTVEQLTSTQWHVVDSAGHWGRGVSTWTDAVSAALWTALLTNRGVESIAFDGTRLLLLRPGQGA
jgi:hypothetical protein